MATVIYEKALLAVLQERPRQPVSALRQRGNAKTPVWATILVGDDPASGTCTVCHSRTENLPEIVGRADTVVASPWRP
jgi:5,10-methylene-tetrahydrofolate dehydrogenase/methenyl tetrahydrofolate cyclohydrolase